uniref:Uncharacterized protein n=4 Tax=Cereibacter sphaeroides TaxID=1063 RepID=O54072_CERSP|nr:hypothetical protein [Cereibacter sphaeroides]
MLSTSERPDAEPVRICSCGWTITDPDPKDRIRAEDAAERSILRMKEIGKLYEADGRYEFRVDDMSLIVRGDHPEWVMQAASEVVSKTARLEGESRIEELEALIEFEGASEIEVDGAKYAQKERFETIPQCIVTIGKMDYRWAAPEGREKHACEFSGNPYRRIHDMSMTFHDSFLQNENGVETSEK